MNEKIIKIWEKNKTELENHFSITSQKEYSSYKDIFKLLMEKCFSDDMDVNGSSITEIGGGIHETSLLISSYHDCYFVTIVSYGSCSGCDTLASINDDWVDTGIPDKEQIEDYMTLCLHMVQRMEILETFNYQIDLLSNFNTS